MLHRFTYLSDPLFGLRLEPARVGGMFCARGLRVDFGEIFVGKYQEILQPGIPPKRLFNGRKLSARQGSEAGHDVKIIENSLAQFWREQRLGERFESALLQSPQRSHQIAA